MNIHTVRKLPCVLLLTLLLALLCPAQAVSPARWAKFEFLLGSWSAVGSGSPGEGAGEFSFTPDLQNRVLIRRSHTNYPAAANRPAFAHDDLLIIHEDEGGSFHADYYDNEGHVIRYTIEFSSDGNTCTLISESAAGVPQFRLTYNKRKEGEVAIKFEIAPPGQPNNFQKYVEGTAKRKSPAIPAKSAGPIR